jgi:hypothetical protein
MEMEAREKPFAEQGSDNPYGAVADCAETGTTDEPARKKAGNGTNEQNDDDPFVRKVHAKSSGKPAAAQETPPTPCFESDPSISQAARDQAFGSTRQT